MKSLSTISHGYYQPYFYWMFPILVAKEERLFESHGVDLQIHDIAPQGQPEDKAGWYKQALDTRSRDFYFCCAWQGVYSTAQTGKGKIGAAIMSSLIKTFAIYTRPDSGIESVLDLVRLGKPIAVNKNADAHYVTLKNLAQLVPESEIKLAHIGGVEKCLQALRSKEVDAATLAGPYAEAAEAIGYRRLLPLARTEPTLVVFNDALGEEAMSSFLDAVNEAIGLVNSDRTKYKRRYVQEFEQAVSRFLPDFAGDLPGLSPKITLPVWGEAKMLSENEFSEIHSFLLDHGLSQEGRGYADTVDSQIWFSH